MNAYTPVNYAYGIAESNEATSDGTKADFLGKILEESGEHAAGD